MRQERDDELPPLSSYADGRYARKPRAQGTPNPRPTPPEPPRRGGTPARSLANDARRQAPSRASQPAEPRGGGARPTQTPRTVTARPRKTPTTPQLPDYDIDFQTSQPSSGQPAMPRPIINFKAYHIARQAQSAERAEPASVPSLPVSAAECPRCHGAGFVRVDAPMGHPLFGKAIACTCKEDELEAKRRQELWHMSSLDAFEHMTFASFNPKIPGTREAWEVASHYAEDPDGWLVLSGACGSGKTHLAAAIANLQFSQGAQVLFVVVPKLLDHLRASFAPSSEMPYDALFTKVCEAGLLVLDDMGAEHTTAWAQEKLFQLLNHRYMYGLPTVITTNLDLMTEMDDRVRSRLNDVSLVHHVRLAAEDFRPRHLPQHRRGTS